jgi:hypothetical protein
MLLPIHVTPPFLHPFCPLLSFTQVCTAGAERWGAGDGWDGVLLPRRKALRRLGGWQVQGGSNGSSGSNGDEEFEEVVFLQPGEQDDLPNSNSDSESESEFEKQQQQQQQQGGELHPRFYSEDESDEEGGRLAGRQLQGNEEDRAMPGGMEAPFMADLQQVGGVGAQGGGCKVCWWAPGEGRRGCDIGGGGSQALPRKPSTCCSPGVAGMVTYGVGDAIPHSTRGEHWQSKCGIKTRDLHSCPQPFEQAVLHPHLNSSSSQSQASATRETGVSTDTHPNSLCCSTPCHVS